jgi:hypothetical protein
MTPLLSTRILVGSSTPFNPANVFDISKTTFYFYIVGRLRLASPKFPVHKKKYDNFVSVDRRRPSGSLAQRQKSRAWLGLRGVRDRAAGFGMKKH